MSSLEQDNSDTKSHINELPPPYKKPLFDIDLSESMIFAENKKKIIPRLCLDQQGGIANIDLIDA
jgi:hypothetical protein